MNQTLTTTVHGMTLEEKFTGKKPDVSHLRVFGCIAYVHVLDEKRSKLGLKSCEVYLHWIFFRTKRI